MIRAFVAVPIPDRILQEIERTTTKIRTLGLNARFPKLDSIHLTLKFLGDVEPAKISEVSSSLDDAVRTLAPFEIALQGVGVFPNVRRPRVVWVGVQTLPALLELQRRVEENLVRLGFEPERRSYRPHLTIARLKDTRNLTRLGNFLEEEVTDPRIGSLRVDEVRLMRSILQPQGAQYHQISNHPLGI